MTSAPITAFSSPAGAVPDAGGRWRALAEATAGAFAGLEGDSLPARVAGALATLFGGAALVLDGVGDDAAVVVRGAGNGLTPDAVAARAVALARAATEEHRVLRDDAGGGDCVLAAPLHGPEGPIGAVAVRPAENGADDVAVLQCFAAHAACALDTARRHAIASLAAEKARFEIVESERRHAIGELAAGVAHHLNNLMTVALGNVQLALRQVPASSARSLSAIERAVLDAADVVRRLAASTGGPLVGAQTSLDLNALVEDTLALSSARWHDEAQVRGVAIAARFERGELPAVIADEGELRELLLNLVLNAVDALAEGGELVVRTWAEADRVLCAVSDTGSGMTADVRRRATEPFFTTRGPARRGLGLSVAAGIVERHRGGLTIESCIGRGTTVTVSLPACVAATPPHPDAASEVPPSGRPLRILVVDDEAAVRDTLGELLELAGHETALAATGDEALARLAAEHGAFDLVLCDLGMPGLTGWDVIERAKAAWPRLPVILVTGWGEHPRGGTGRPAPDAVLAKPITDHRLREAVASIARRTP